MCEYTATELHVKPDVEDVAVLDAILFAFEPEEPALFDRFFRCGFDEIVVTEALRPDEPLGQVGVDRPGGTGASSSGLLGAQTRSLVRPRLISPLDVRRRVVLPLTLGPAVVVEVEASVDDVPALRIDGG